MRLRAARAGVLLGGDHFGSHLCNRYQVFSLALLRDSGRVSCVASEWLNCLYDAIAPDRIQANTYSPPRELRVALPQ